MVMYVLPNFGAARRSVWDAIDIQGNRLLEMIPARLIKKINSAEMKITFLNDSILLLIGGESHATSIRGTNPYAVILSEFAYMDDAQAILDTIMPILAANGGWLAIGSTPNGKNTYYHLYKMALELPNWFVTLKKASEINHIPAQELLEEKNRMSEELYMQEYECDFTRGISGSIFGTCLQRLKDNGQITSVAWEPQILVQVVFDIGVSDLCTLIFFQVIGEGTLIRIIDCYSNHGLGLDHYAKIIQDKPYRYGKYFAPPDIMVREWGGGAITRFEKARQLDIPLTVLDQIEVQDSIDNAMAHFPKLWIDKDKCKSLIDALENYYREWDEQKQIHKSKPVHNWASHYADAFRYMCQAIYKTKKGRSGEDFDRARNEALYGNKLQKIFQYDRRYDR